MEEVEIEEAMLENKEADSDEEMEESNSELLNWQRVDVSWSENFS